MRIINAADPHCPYLVADARPGDVLIFSSRDFAAVYVVDAEGKGRQVKKKYWQLFLNVQGYKKEIMMDKFAGYELVKRRLMRGEYESESYGVVYDLELALRIIDNENKRCLGLVELEMWSITPVHPDNPEGEGV